MHRHCRSCPTWTMRPWSRPPKQLLDDPPDVIVATTGIGFRGWLEAADAAGLGERSQCWRPPESWPGGRRRMAPCSRRACGRTGWRSRRPRPSCWNTFWRRVCPDGASRCSTTGPGRTASMRHWLARVRGSCHWWSIGGDRRRTGALTLQSTVAVAAGGIDVVLFTAPGATRGWPPPKLPGRCRQSSSGARAATPSRWPSAGDRRPWLPRASCLWRGPQPARLDDPRTRRSRPGSPGDVDPGRHSAGAALGGAAGRHADPADPSGLAVLRVLADAGGQVVSRQELLVALSGDSNPHTRSRRCPRPRRCRPLT